jgi:hypothetical protein
MIKLTKYEVLKSSILKVSKTLNNKALHEVINNEVYNNDYNDIMYKYYKRIHRKPDLYFYDIREHEDINDLKEDIKSLNGVIYKKLYDYNGFHYQPIKHHNTMCVIETSNGFYNHVQYAFNVYNFIEVNNIEVITS